MNRIDLTGKRFDRWEVLSYSHTNKNKAYWDCICDCGTKKKVPGKCLNTGESSSCGCYARELRVKQVSILREGQPVLPQGQSSFNALFGRYINGSKRRGLVFLLSKEEFRELVTKNCEYCNAFPSSHFTRKDFNGEFIYNGIDRVDNNLGYIKSNVVTCCRSCNVLKSNKSLSEFKATIKRIYEHCIKQ